MEIQDKTSFKIDRMVGSEDNNKTYGAMNFSICRRAYYNKIQYSFRHYFIFIVILYYNTRKLMIKTKN